MHIRKLQRTGGTSGSSFLVILPKEWVLARNLKKGDPVVIAEREDGCLIVDPRLPMGIGKRSTEVEMKSNLAWQVTSKYLLGFDKIKVVSSKKITKQQRNELKDIIKRFVSLEITEENGHSIMIQCLIDPSRLGVDKAIRRMYLIASRMLDDALVAYIDGDSELSQSVVERDEEVDRLFFLIVRELRSTIQYPRMSESMGIRPVEALDFRLAAQYIERIADLAEDIAVRVEKPINKKIAEKIQQVCKDVKDMLDKSVSNLFDFETEKVNRVIQAEKELGGTTARVRKELMAELEEQSQRHLYIVDILQRIGEAAKDIADLALPNHQ
ncbi:MAG: PhoU domain-containing protein [Promethearchaeia archaeon]